MDFLSPLENDRRLPTKQFVETEQHFDGAAVPFSVFGSYFGVKPLDISMGHVRDQTLEPNVMANEGTAYARQQFGIQTIGFQDLQLSE
jgi:hypothetical protein